MSACPAREFFHQKFSHVDIDRDGPSVRASYHRREGIVSRDTNFSRRRAALAKSVCVGVSFRVSEWPFTQESMLASHLANLNFPSELAAYWSKRVSRFWAESLSESPVIAAPARRGRVTLVTEYVLPRSDVCCSLRATSVFETFIESCHKMTPEIASFCTALQSTLNAAWRPCYLETLLH